MLILDYFHKPRLLYGLPAFIEQKHGLIEYNSFSSCITYTIIQKRIRIKGKKILSSFLLILNF